jgi:hypothetical protein
MDWIDKLARERLKDTGQSSRTALKKIEEGQNPVEVLRIPKANMGKGVSEYLVQWLRKEVGPKSH